MHRAMHKRGIGCARNQPRPFVAAVLGGVQARRSMPAAPAPAHRARTGASASSATGIQQLHTVHAEGGFSMSRSRRAAAVVCQAKPKSMGEFEVTQQQMAGCTVKLSVKVPPKVVKKCETRVVDKLTKLIGKVPGFPSNKPLPLGIVIDRCGGPKKYALAVIEEIMLLSYQQVMEPYNNIMYPDSDTMLTNVADLVATLDTSKPLEYELQFEMIPDVKWKSPYKDIQITIQDTGSDETDAEAADDFIKQELKSKGFQRIVSNRGLKESDIAVIDLVVKLPGSKQPIPGMSKELLAFDTEVDTLGLTPNIIGMQPGEGRQFQIRFPDDWPEEELRGQAADVSIKMSELFEWQLPEFDEAFVKKHYPQYETPAAMRQAIINTTAMQRFQQRDDDIQEAFLAQLVKIVDVKVPENLINDIGANEYQRNLLLMVGQGNLKLQEAQDLMTEEKVKGYTKANWGQLEELGKVQLGSAEIIEAEGLEVEESVLAAEMETAKEQFRAQKTEYDEERLREQATEALKAAALINWVKNNCKIEIKPFVAAPAS